MTAAKRPQPITENKPSFLLTREENEQLFRLIGNRCKVIVMSLETGVQYFMCEFFAEHCNCSCSGSLSQSSKLLPMEQATLWSFVLYKRQRKEVVFLPHILFNKTRIAVGARIIQFVWIPCSSTLLPYFWGWCK